MSFLQFHLRQTPYPDDQLADGFAHLLKQSAKGLPRAALNDAYFALLSGLSWTQLLAEGKAWFTELAADADHFVTKGIQAARQHHARNDDVVLVSGSFLPCLAPVASYVGAGTVLCTEPLIDSDGKLTGKTRTAMLDATKADAVRGYLADHRLDATACHAYGDHASDLAMLAIVGHPHVVGDDPVLRRAAADQGWADW